MGDRESTLPRLNGKSKRALGSASLSRRGLGGCTRCTRVIYGSLVPVPLGARGGQDASPLIAFASQYAQSRYRSVGGCQGPQTIGRQAGRTFPSSEGRNPFGGGKAPPPEPRQVNSSTRPFSPPVIEEKKLLEAEDQSLLCASSSFWCIPVLPSGLCLRDSCEVCLTGDEIMEE